MPRVEAEKLPEGPKARELLLQAQAWPLAREIHARWERPAPVRTYELPLYVRVEVKLTLDPEQWHAGFLSVQERELPAELYADLREVSPQAVLRDLYRPVREFYVTPEEIEGTAVHNQMPKIFREMRQARRLDERIDVEMLTKVVRESQLRRRAFLASPWQPVKPDDEPRTPIHGL